jgi:hypothetical protein
MVVAGGPVGLVPLIGRQAELGANIKGKLGVDTRIDAAVRAREIVTAQATRPSG